MVYKKDIESLIAVRINSTLKNHWFYASSNKCHVNGEVRENNILIWKNSYFLRMAYPIFVVSFDENDLYQTFKVIDNPYFALSKKVVFCLIILLLAVVFISYDLRTAMIGSSFIVLLSLAAYLVMKKSVAFETKILVENFKDELAKISAKNSSNIKVNLIERKYNHTKEWTIMKTIMRIILYPACVLLIYGAIELLFKNGKIIQGVTGIIVASLFMLSDLLIIFKMEDNTFTKKILEFFKLK
jgi:hypothetical protein